MHRLSIIRANLGCIQAGWVKLRPNAGPFRTYSTWLGQPRLVPSSTGPSVQFVTNCHFGPTQPRLNPSLMLLGSLPYDQSFVPAKLDLHELSIYLCKRLDVIFGIFDPKESHTRGLNSQFTCSIQTLRWILNFSTANWTVELNRAWRTRADDAAVATDECDGIGAMFVKSTGRWQVDSSLLVDEI